MKKRNKLKGLESSQIKNMVAKFAFQFNKAQVFKDKTKYQRKAKHQGKEPFPIMLYSSIGKGFCFGAYLNFMGTWCIKPYFFNQRQVISRFVNGTTSLYQPINIFN